LGTQVSINAGATGDIVSTSILSTGKPIQVIVTGDANPTGAGAWCRLQLFRGSTAIGQAVQAESSTSNENVPYCIQVVDVPSSGTATYTLKATAVAGATFQFGEAAGPVISAIELQGVQGPQGPFPTIANDVDTRLVTANGNGTLNAEGNLSFNGSVLSVTGTINTSGNTTIGGELTVGTSTAAGNEGGQIALAQAPSSGGLTGANINIDVYTSKVRIFEGGGNARGVSIDLSKAPDGVGGEITWKASGIVNSGVDVTLGNLKARMAGSGNRSLQVSTVSGTYSVIGSGVYSYNGIGGTTLSSLLTITTTPTYIVAGYQFGVAGSTDTWILMDAANNIAWRISMIVGFSYNNNMITIERLV
jgi:hypothetical protein